MASLATSGTRSNVETTKVRSNRITIARPLPQSIACRRCAAGSRCAARAMTIALSPETTALTSTI